MEVFGTKWYSLIHETRDSFWFSSYIELFSGQKLERVVCLVNQTVEWLNLYILRMFSEKFKMLKHVLRLGIGVIEGI